MVECTGGQAVAASLAAAGVEVVFGIPGTHNLPVYEHLPAHGIRHVAPRHEQGAGFAADGYARVSGRPGVCLVTTGPAVTNLATAVAQAYSDSVPVLVVSPGVPTTNPATGSGFLHEAKDLSGAMQHLVAASHRVTTVGEIPSAIALAFTTMTTGRPRPVHVEIPVDLLEATGEVVVVPPAPAVPLRPDPGAVEHAAGVLGHAIAPGIIAGGGARGAAARARALAALLGAPVVTTTNGKGVLDEAHPLALGAVAHLSATRAFLAECDAVLAVGTELAPADFWEGLPALDTLVRVDVDPAQAHANHPADAVVLGGAAAALAELLAALGQGEADSGHARATAARRAIHSEAQQQGRRWLPLLAALRAALPDDAVLAGDSAMVCYYGATPNLAMTEAGRWLYPTGYGTLGYALPAAIGAKIAAPDRPVAALLGDGGIMFTLPELAAAAAEGLALPVVVVNNRGYGEIRDEMRTRGMEPYAVDLPAPDFAAVGRALGGRGVHVDDPAALRDAVDTALAADTPTLIAIDEPAP
jgi:thiamine pyrophosphate-dependent acetolactate synthase large subunit-like protein